ncbi:MAG: hypothetical protein OEY07_14370, partial [Gammaproteobacteria bacterium]|nr:hypothetical protein [Gammaproteobacteria bacterium]
QGTTARKHLNQMILSVAGQDDDATVLWLKRWRKLIVMCYLSARQVDDARTAIQRYQQDYTAKDAATLILRARILLMNDQAQDSVELLASHTDKPEADMLYLLARLRAGILTPVEAVKIGLQQITTHGADERLGYSLWAVVAEASQRAGDRTTAVNALEHVVAYRQRKSVDTLFDFNIDSLWNAYIDFALYQGNKAQFLIGQDEKWFAAAKKYFRKKPLIARAYYALLMHRAQGEESRVAAADMLVKSLKRRKHGGEILRQLFVRSKYFPAISDVPEPARRTLVDVALAQNDIPLASEIMATLVTPPKDNTGYMWYLRRARILVLGGQAQRGADALNEFITGKGDKLSKEQVERLLQVVFDLQTVGAHDAAIQLFQRVSTLTDDEKIRRELFYWMADSRRAQNRYPEAAHLYLKSAMLPDGKGLDPWGQTARYQAAECLGQAGLIEDAHELFQHLLRVTREADRRAVLEHEIHKLRLSRVRENKAATEEIVEQGVE